MRLAVSRRRAYTNISDAIQPKRLPREVARHLRRHAAGAHPRAALRQLLPGGRARAPPARRPRPRGRRGRDVRHGHQHPQGAEGGREDGRLQALEGPGERHRLEPGLGIEDLYGRPLGGSPVPYVWLDATYVKEPTRLRDCFPQDSQSNIIPKAYLKPSPTGA